MTLLAVFLRLPLLLAYVNPRLSRVAALVRRGEFRPSALLTAFRSNDA